MSTDSDPISQIEGAIAALEAQRSILGDAAVDLAQGALGQQLSELREAAASPAALEGEYKLVTTMFADVSGYTALTEQLGAEQVRTLMNDCFERLVPTVQQYDGTVVRFMGDAVMALFGAPLAHENDPERALRAALAMQEALTAFNQARGTDLGLHFGINTGVVVAGGIGSSGLMEYSVTGDAVNLAKRLEDASERGEIRVGPDTYRLTAALFDFEALPPLQVKGKATPVVTYRLRGPRSAGPLARGIAGVRSPLVGRDREMLRLQAAFEALRHWQGGKIAIIAEAGVGKSRLVAEARQPQAGITWAEGRALSYTQALSYWVTRDVLYALLGEKLDAPPEAVIGKLRLSVEQIVPEQAEELYPLLARLLELPLTEQEAERLAQFGPEVLQRQMLRAVHSYVRAQAEQQPLVLVWEDLHWADPSSLNLLETLFPLTEDSPLLLLMVYRPEEGPIQAFHQRLGAAANGEDAVIELTALSRDDSIRLIQNLMQWEELPAETRRLILDKAEGNAFFLEEVLRSLIDAGMVLLQGDRLVATQAIHELQIPDTLQGVIMARIDRLPQHEKQTLQTASVIGRVFQQLVLTHLLSPAAADDTVDRSLAELRRRELIRLRQAETLSPLPDESEYIFKHAITQDVAYQSLLVARRKALHHQVGETLEALFPDRLPELAGTLAYHYERAEVRDKAIQYLQEAADRARSTYANEEAIAFYRRGVEQVRPLLAAEGAERVNWQRIALSLLESLGEALELAARHEEARSAYEEALSIVPAADPVTRARLLRKIGRVLDGLQRFDDALQMFALAESALGEPSGALSAEGWQEWIEILLDRIRTHYWRSEVPEMVALIERLQSPVDQHGLPRQRSRLTYTRLNVSFRRERYRLSDQTLAYARAFLADSQQSEELNTLTTAHFVMGFTHLWRSELDEAEKQLKASLSLADRIGDVTYQSMGMTYLAVIHRMRGKVEAVRQLVPRCRDLGAAAYRINYVGTADANEAWVAWRDGDLAQVDASARSALSHWQHPSAGVNPFHWLALWPLIGAALARDETVTAIEHARALFASTQQLPPDALAAPLQAAIAAWETGRTDEARGLLEGSLQIAMEEGYL